MTVDILRFAGYQDSASPLSVALRTLADELDGAGLGCPQVQMDVTAQGESAGALFDSLERGERQIGYMASGYLSARVPDLAVLDLPFGVVERDAALATLDGYAGYLLREAVARDSGFYVLAFWDNGFRHISNRIRPLRRPADCRALVIRTLDSELYRQSLGAFGFQVITSDVKDLVRMVGTGVVDAQENPLSNFLGFRLWQYHRHVSLTEHVFGIVLLVCPRTWHDTLSLAQRNRLASAVRRATSVQRQSARTQDAAALPRLWAHGVHVLGSDDLDQVAWREAVEPIRREAIAQLPARLVRAYLPHCT